MQVFDCDGAVEELQNSGRISRDLVTAFGPDALNADGSVNRDMLRDIVNNQLIPRMVKHGFPVKGLRFEWEYAVDYTPEQQVAYETMIADRYEVDPEYFANKYSMPVGGRRQVMPTPVAEDNTGQDDGKKKQQNPKDFFD